MGVFTDLFASTLERALIAIPWPEIAGEAWKYAKKVFSGSSLDGLYIAEKLSVQLELLDASGEIARYKKTKKVKYLQNGIISYQDYAWGDGKILQNYNTNIGRVVDQYRLGHKTYVLLFLESERNKGDKDDFQISWEISNSFSKEEGSWETDISQKTKNLEIEVIFPKSRKPLQAQIWMVHQRKKIDIDPGQFRQLKDGRVRVCWSTKKPRLYEHYILKWIW